MQIIYIILELPANCVILGIADLKAVLVNFKENLEIMCICFIPKSFSQILSKFEYYYSFFNLKLIRIKKINIEEIIPTP